MAHLIHSDSAIDASGRRKYRVWLSKHTDVDYTGGTASPSGQNTGIYVGAEAAFETYELNTANIKIRDLKKKYPSSTILPATFDSPDGGLVWPRGEQGIPPLNSEPAGLEGNNSGGSLYDEESPVEAEKNLKRRAPRNIVPPPSQKGKKLGGMPKSERDAVNNLTTSEKILLDRAGQCGKSKEEVVVNFNEADGEKIIRGKKNNAFIIMGNDRPGGLCSGYGRGGEGACSEIFLVAGLGGGSPLDVREINSEGGFVEEKVYTNPNNTKDSAFIRITQKTDIDENFNLIPLKNMPQTKGHSAVAMKADAIRIVARETMKLVTATDSHNSLQDGNNKIESVHGIVLMTGNNEEAEKQLQPLVKGENLEKGLRGLVDHLKKTINIFHGFMKYQMKYNEATATHYHYSPFFGIPTSPSFPIMQAGFQCNLELVTKTETSVMLELANLDNFKQNYFTKSGTRYINSSFHRCN